MTKINRPYDRIVDEAPETLPLIDKINVIFRHTHRDFKSTINGERYVLVNRRAEGTCLVAIKDLTEAELADKLAYALKKERARLEARAEQDWNLTNAKIQIF